MRGGDAKQRKDRHIEVCLAEDVEYPQSTGLEKLRLQARLPDFLPLEMDLSCVFLGRKLSMPLLIAPITGGGTKSARINRNLAVAAEHCGIAMAVGSEYSMMEGKVDRESYLLRDVAPGIPLLGNLGLMHLKRGREYVKEAIESMGADGIIIYINPLHEIIQVNGDTDFGRCLETLEAICAGFPYPVFVKEVGFGLDPATIQFVSQIGVAGADVAGVGGTSWGRIEGLIQERDYSLYEEIGIPTSDAVRIASSILRPDQCLIASGGVRNGLDMAKCFALGANMVSMALPFLKWADKGSEEVILGIERMKQELSICLWCCGCRRVSDLKGRLLPYKSL
jgi:isopentenyl-diphosphate Delta-isomerase